MDAVATIAKRNAAREKRGFSMGFSRTGGRRVGDHGLAPMASEHDSEASAITQWGGFDSHLWQPGL
jgi:hypothetical protein